MKKLLLSIFTMAAFGSAFSQCIPDGQTNGQIAFPVPTTTSDTANEATVSGSPLSSFPNVIQFKLPSDTTVGGFSAQIDSVTVISITGLPAGTVYACNTGNCKWAGGTNGCLQFFNPTGASGYPEIKINLNAKISIGSLPFSLYYKFDAATVGIDEVLSAKTFSMIQNAPNPFSTSTTISFSTPNTVQATFEVFNVLGEKVHTKAIKGNAGINTIEFDGSSLNNGVYFYSLNNGEKTLTGKMTISK